MVWRLYFVSKPVNKMNVEAIFYTVQVLFKYVCIVLCLAISLTTVMLAVHRLDRLVSGLLILARNASQADIFRQQVSFLNRGICYIKLIGITF